MPNDGMTPSWKKWPGSTDWVHGRPVPDPGDERNFKYIEKQNASEEDAKKPSKKRMTVKDALKKLKPKARGGGSVGGNTVGDLATGSRNRAIKKLMKDM
jgi:hypothetical protein